MLVQDYIDVCEECRVCVDDIPDAEIHDIYVC